MDKGAVCRLNIEGQNWTQLALDPGSGAQWVSHTASAIFESRKTCVFTTQFVDIKMVRALTIAN